MNKNYRLNRFIKWNIQVLISIIVIFIHSIVLAGLSVDPVTVEVVALKGGEKPGVFKVINTGATPILIRIDTEKWRGTDINIAKWLVLDPVEFKLASGATKEVSYKITPPEDSNGELRCMVFFVADEIGEQVSGVGIRFGVPIYAIVGGTEIIDAEITDITVDYDYESKVLGGTIYVNNKSNIHIRPHVEMVMYDNKDKLITSFIHPYGQPAQAGQNRAFVFQQSLALGEGEYKLIVKVDYGKLYGVTDKIAEGKAVFVVKVPKVEDNQEKKDEEEK